MKRLLCPSMMCANYGHLASEVRALDDAGADIFHCDIMDGSFVPNFTMGVMDVQTIRRYTDKPVDCHLMIENPGSKVDWFIRAGANIIYIHPESERYVVKTLAHIKEMGAFAGIAVNPDTSIASISEILNLCDYVMVMTVNPGYGGQSFMPEVLPKIAELRRHVGPDSPLDIMVDGGINFETGMRCAAAGANQFVAGSFLFKQSEMGEAVARMREGCGKAYGTELGAY